MLNLKSHIDLLGDFAFRTAAYGASSTLGAYFSTPFSFLGGATVALINSASVTLVQRGTKAEDNSYRHACQTAAVLALTTFALTLGALRPLAAHLGCEMTKKTVVQLAFFNAFGELVKAVFVKYFFAHPKLSEPEHKPSIEIKFPRSVESRVVLKEIEDLNLESARYIYDHFKDYYPRLRAVEAIKAPIYFGWDPDSGELKRDSLEVESLDPTVFEALDKRVEELGIVVKKPLKTEEDVKGLSFYQLVCVFTSYDSYEKELDQEVLKALRYRFYQEDLPFPNNETLDSIDQKRCEDLYLIGLAVPQSFEEIKSLTRNQLAWLFNDLQDRDMKQVSFNVQAKLNLAFAKEFGWELKLKPTLENLEGITQESIQLVHEYYQEQRTEFTVLPLTIKNILNHQFYLVNLDLLATRFIIEGDLRELNKEEAPIFYRYFVNNQSEWGKLDSNMKKGFNRKFSEVLKESIDC